MLSKRQLALSVRCHGAVALGGLAAGTGGAAPGRGRAPATFRTRSCTTHDGRKLRFYDDVVRGKVVAFNMMYTACAGICPGNTANLKLVQEALSDQLGKHVFMYSMTLRPDIDTPQALQRLREALRHSPRLDLPHRQACRDGPDPTQARFLQRRPRPRRRSEPAHRAWCESATRRSIAGPCARRLGFAETDRANAILQLRT